MVPLGKGGEREEGEVVPLGKGGERRGRWFPWGRGERKEGEVVPLGRVGERRGRWFKTISFTKVNSQLCPTHTTSL